MGLADRLKQAIFDSQMSFNALSRATGIAVPIISRFATGRRSVNIETADRLADYFGLELRAKRGPRKSSRPLAPKNLSLPRSGGVSNPG